MVDREIVTAEFRTGLAIFAAILRTPANRTAK
jgi:hypothetical protein